MAVSARRPCARPGCPGFAQFGDYCASCAAKLNRATKAQGSTVAPRGHDPRWQGKSMAQVVLVAGPPGAGKTHYVSQRMKAGDVVVDVDAILAALTGRPWYEHTPQQLWLALDVRDFLFDRLRHPTDLYTAWVITSEARASERERLAAQCGASKTIMLLEPAHVCLYRIGHDGRRAEALPHWREIVTRWWSEYEPVDGEVVVTSQA